MSVLYGSFTWYWKRKYPLLDKIYMTYSNLEALEPSTIYWLQWIIMISVQRTSVLKLSNVLIKVKEKWQDDSKVVWVLLESLKIKQYWESRYK